MDDKLSLDERLAFYQLNPEDHAFKGVSLAIRDQMDAALDSFYEKIPAHGELESKFTDQQAMDRIRRAQARHWVNSFDKGLTKKSYRRSEQLGEVQASIALEPKWYLGSYALILEDLVCRLVAPGWRRYLPWNRVKVRQLVALLKVSLLDIDIALSAYFRGLNCKVNFLNDVLGSALTELAQGRLNLGELDLPKGYRQVAEDFNFTLASLNRTIGAVTASVETIDTGSVEIRHPSGDLACRTEQQAASLEGTAASVSDASNRMSAASQTTNLARKTIKDTTQSAHEGTMTAARAVEAVSRFDQSSQAINTIITDIKSIALQTNLLALNAGVEAAKAEENGKGFAVVASEVRAMVQRCAQAADEVRKLTSATGDDVQSGVDLVNSSETAFASISSKVAELAQTVLAVADTMNVQNENLDQINAVVGKLDRITQQNAVIAERCTAAASSLAKETQRLKSTVAAFEVNGSSPKIALPTRNRPHMWLATGQGA